MNIRTREVDPYSCITYCCVCPKGFRYAHVVVAIGGKGPVHLCAHHAAALARSLVESSRMVNQHFTQEAASVAAHTEQQWSST